MAVATPVATALPAMADRAGHREEDSWPDLNKVLKAAQAVIRYTSSIILHLFHANDFYRDTAKTLSVQLLLSN